jgi:hypothetical protein
MEPTGERSPVLRHKLASREKRRHLWAQRTAIAEYEHAVGLRDEAVSNPSVVAAVTGVSEAEAIATAERRLEEANVKLDSTAAALLASMERLSDLWNLTYNLDFS